MRFLALIFVLLAAQIALPAAAQDRSDYLAVHLGSYHTDRNTSLNETNLGLGYGRIWRPGWAECSAEAGAYWNSHDKLAAYGLGACATPGTYSVGAFLGAASGYQDIPGHVHGVIPIAGLQFMAGPLMFRVNREVAFLSLRFEVR